jgi:hypothetical protein
MSFWNFLGKKTEFKKDDPTRLAVRGKYLLSDIDEDTLINRKKRMLDFLISQNYVLDASQEFILRSAPTNQIQFLLNFQSFTFNTNYFSKKLSPTLSDKFWYHISGQSPEASCHFRNLKGVREDLPVEVGIRFIVNAQKEYIVEIVVFPAKFQKFSQLVEERTNFKLDELLFYITRSIELAKDIGANLDAKEIQEPNMVGVLPVEIPSHILNSLGDFKKDFPSSKKVAFIMMQFEETQEHTNILKSIRKTLAENDMIGIRADDKIYNDDTFYNILTYLHGCDFGIAVFEKLSDESFNPNVSLEVGYLLGLNKPICYLKEKSLPKLPSDLIGKLYREFTVENCDVSISNELRNWLDDKKIIRN